MSVVGCVLDPIGCAVGSAAKAAAASAFDGICTDFAHAAGSVVSWLWSTMGQATAVSFGGPGWARDLGITVLLGVVVSTALFLIQIIASALRRDTVGIWHAVRGMPIAVGATVGVIAVLNLLLSATDSLANGIMRVGTGGDTWTELGKQILDFQNVTVTVLSPALLLVVAILAMVASFVVWGALVIRKLLLIVAAVFTPVAFAGAASDLTRGWVRKWIDLTMALVFSKIILVIIFVVGLGVLTQQLGAG